MVNADNDSVKAGSGSGSGTGKSAGNDDASLAGIIDTIEAVVIALIVALTFRAFIVEAFVIPTGSMAPTLLGAHFKVICPKCGYEYDLNAPLGYQAVYDEKHQLVIPNSLNQRAELGPNYLVPFLEDHAACPNCRFAITDPTALPQYLESPPVRDFRANQVHPVPFVWANNGDRILVLKYIYSVMEPKRWDVIVFKEPEAARDNFIKRLIGLPGDTVEVINGDVYIGRGVEGEANATQRLIARKPEELQQSLWQLVFNNDYYPTDEGTPRLTGPDWINPWTPVGSWTKGTTMTCQSPGPAALVFHPAAGMPQGYPPYGLNTLGYNNDMDKDENGLRPEMSARSIVGDLRLETLWTPRPGGEKEVKLTLGRPNNCYQAGWNAGALTLSRYNMTTKAFDAVPATVYTATIPQHPGQSYRLALDNVDHAVRFYVDGHKVLEYEEPWSAAQAAADLKAFPADWSTVPRMGGASTASVDTLIRIDVAGACDLSHLKLFRDLYYTQLLPEWVNEQHGGIKGTALQDNPLTLGPDEFFAMGDNSRASSDGRLWTRVYDPLADLGLRPGVVPRRYLLGKAFFVYWPAGFRPTEQVPWLDKLPLVPNTGDMRLIR
jgi:signal peptidase I